MPVNDLFQATVVSSYGPATYNNNFYAQITAENDPLDSLRDLSIIVRDQIVNNLAKVCVDGWRATAIVVRRLKPAISDVFVLQQNRAGDLPQVGLSSTCFTLLRYYCDPYEAGQANHWKILGLPRDANNGGLMSEQSVVRYTDLIEALTLSPYTNPGSTFNFVRAPKRDEIVTGPLPVIRKCQVDNTIRNLRSRQIRQT